MWNEGNWALSAGLQARLAYVPWAGDEFVSTLALRETRVFGGDAVVLVGRTSSQLYDLYFGARVGYTYGASALSHPAVDAGAAIDASGHRVETGVVLGLRVGFGRVAGVIELDAAVTPFVASATGVASSSGVAFALRPAAALAFGF